MQTAEKWDLQKRLEEAENARHGAEKELASVKGSLQAASEQREAALVQAQHDQVIARSHSWHMKHPTSSAACLLLSCMPLLLQHQPWCHEFWPVLLQQLATSISCAMM